MGMRGCLLSDILASENTRSATLRTCRCHPSEAGIQLAPAQNKEYLTSLLSPVAFSHVPHVPALSQKYPEPFNFAKTDWRFVHPFLIWLPPK